VGAVVGAAFVSLVLDDLLKVFPDAAISVCQKPSAHLIQPPVFVPIGFVSSDPFPILLLYNM
jgi:hypothetical protein